MLEQIPNPEEKIAIRSSPRFGQYRLYSCGIYQWCM